jgi:hypothetical protein
MMFAAGRRVAVGVVFIVGEEECKVEEREWSAHHI